MYAALLIISAHWWQTVQVWCLYVKNYRLKESKFNDVGFELEKSPVYKFVTQGIISAHFRPSIYTLN